MISPGLKAQEQNQAKLEEARVRTLFKNWEEAQSRLTHFDARILITETSQPSKEITWRRVSVKYLKSDDPSHPVPYLEMRLCQWPEEMPMDYLVCQDFFYVFNHEKEVVKSYEIGALESYLKTLGPVRSLFGKSQDRFRESLPCVFLSTSPMALVDRYEIRLAKEDDKTAQFDLLPLAKSDRELFEKGHLTLSKTQGLPLAIKWEEKDGTKLSYELEQMDLVRAWKPGHFRKPNSLNEFTGWTFERSKESFPDESKKEDPDKAEAAPYFQKWEDALAKIERMDAMIHATGDTSSGLSVNFPVRIKYQKTTKNATERKSYDLSFLAKKHQILSRLIILDHQCFAFNDTEKTVESVGITGELNQSFKDLIENKQQLSWINDGIFFDFKLIVCLLTPKELLDRYHVRLISEDDRYAQFEVLPSKAKDRKSLSWANIVLDKKTFLLSSVTYKNRSGDSQGFEIKGLNLDPKFQPPDFETPTPETWKGWQFQSWNRSKRANEID